MSKHQDHCQPPEITIEDMIARRDWKALDSEFGGYQESGRPIILYKMLKALLDKVAAEK